MLHYFMMTLFAKLVVLEEPLQLVYCIITLKSHGYIPTTNNAEDLRKQFSLQFIDICSKLHRRQNFRFSLSKDFLTISFCHGKLLRNFSF